MFVILLLIPLILGIGRVKEDKERFGITTTKSLKGFFAAGVVLHHLCTYFYPPLVSLMAFKNMGFVMVSGFLLISGYGLTLSAQRKKGYCKHFLWKRVLPIVVTYYITAIVYAIVLNTKNMLDADRIKSLAFGSSYWFIWAIVILYIGFWFAYRFFKGNGSIVIITLWTIAYMAVMFLKTRNGEEGIGFWWFNSAPAFLCGVYFAAFKDKLLPLLKNSMTLKISIILFMIFFVISNMIERPTSLILLASQLVSSVSVSVATIAFTMHYTVDNFVLKGLGKVSLELYLVQALWIAVIGYENNSIRDCLIQIDLIIVVTIASSFAIHYISIWLMWIPNKLHGLLFAQNKNKTIAE